MELCYNLNTFTKTFSYCVDTKIHIHDYIAIKVLNTGAFNEKNYVYFLTRSNFF